MKYFARVITGMVAAILLLQSCSKDNISPQYFLTATVNDRPIKATSVTFMVDNADTSKSHFHVIAETPVGRIALLVSNYTPAQANYEIGPDVFALINDSGHYHTGISGTISVKSFAPNASGTFHFMCDDSTMVTDGKFNTISR